MRNQRLFKLILGGAAFCFCLNAQPPCSIGTVRGVWARATGVNTVMMAAPGATQAIPAPLAELGLASIDEQGRLSGWVNGMLAGDYFDVAVTGRVEVNADCSGTIRFSATPLGTTTPLPGEGVVRIIVLDNGNAMRGMATTGILGKPVGMELHRRLVKNATAGPKCSLNTVRGTYALGGDLGTGLGVVQMPGQAQPVTVPLSGIGMVAIESSGAVTGGFTNSMAGQMGEWELTNSKVEVFEDCTGFFTFQSKPKGTSGAASGPGGVEKFVILENGEEVWTLTISTGRAKPITPGSWKRISKDAGPVVW